MSEANTTKIETLKINNYNFSIVRLKEAIWVRGKEFGLFLEYKSSDKLIRNFVSNENKKKFGKLIDAQNLLSNCNKTMYINKNGIKEIILKSTKMPEKIMLLSKAFDLDVNIINCRTITKEQNEIDKILKVFRNEKYIMQYVVKPYRFDLYFTEWKIGIECDEDRHKYRDTEYEKIREQFLKDKLGCNIIRFNSDEKDYDIFNIIGQIYDQICLLAKK